MPVAPGQGASAFLLTSKKTYAGKTDLHIELSKTRFMKD